MKLWLLYISYLRNKAGMERCTNKASYRRRDRRMDGWMKWNLDCLLDNMLVLTQMTDIIERSSSNTI